MKKQFLILIAGFLSMQSWSEVVSTNLANGSFFVVYGPGYGGWMKYGRLGKTNQIVLKSGEEIVIHGINIVPIDQNASQAFVRKKNPIGQEFVIGTSSTNSGFVSTWKGPIVGPATIEYGLDPARATYETQLLDESSTFLKTYCDFLLEIKDSSVTSTNFVNTTISLSSVVVPSNATGDVDVLLEQSTDMITWTQCLPGTYSASTQKRFFRVRAVEK
jgi:hypothetical protein